MASLSHANSFTKIPLFSETLPIPFSSELVRICPFEIKPSEDLEVKPLTCTPWTKPEMRAVVKDFPKITKDPHRFAEEFTIIIQIYHPGFSDLHQLVHEGQAQYWMKIAN